MMRIAGDPDVSIGPWLADSAAVGIEREIPPHGIFPKLTEEEAIRAAKGYAAVDVGRHEAGFHNYTSYSEQMEWADA